MTWHRLTHLTAFTIEGQDAVAFAQSQLTCDVEQCAANQWHPGAWCGPQGLVKAIMLVRREPNAVACILPSEQATAICKALEKFTIGRQVKLTSPHPVIGTFQKPADNALSFDRSRGLDLDNQHTPPAPPHALDQWRECDMAKGLAWLNEALEDTFLPQALGLEALGGLSYQKGCYPGQEVIAKIHYRGRVKQALVNLNILTHGVHLTPGTALFPSQASGEHAHPNTQALGQVIGQGGRLALAVVKVDALNQDGVALSPGGPTIATLDPIPSNALAGV